MFSRNITVPSKKPFSLFHYNKPTFPFLTVSSTSKSFHFLPKVSSNTHCVLRPSKYKILKATPKISSLSNPLPHYKHEKKNLFAFYTGTESSLNWNVITSNRLLCFYTVLKGICIPQMVILDQQFSFKGSAFRGGQTKASLNFGASQVKLLYICL